MGVTTTLGVISRIHRYLGMHYGFPPPSSAGGGGGGSCRGGPGAGVAEEVTEAGRRAAVEGRELWLSLFIRPYLYLDRAWPP